MKRDRSPEEEATLTHSQKKQNFKKQQNAGALELFIQNQKTIKILNERGVKFLFPIQYHSYYDINKGSDIIARDRTGSGKTLAYSLPIIQRFRDLKLFGENSELKMLVLLPTRELAVQVSQQITSLRHHSNEYRVALAYGGSSVQEQRQAIRSGCDILVATPGRLLDFLDKGVVPTKHLSVICLDQADQMLKMGFKQDVDRILRVIKQKSSTYHIQTLLFSATLPQWVVTLSKTYLSPAHKTFNMISQQSNSCSTTIKHYKVQCTKKRRIQIIAKLISHFIPKEGRCVIFCETKKQTNLFQSELGYKLTDPVHALHGDINQEQRLRTFSSMKSGKLRFVVATNVAARGLDIPNIQLIIQCSPPKDTEVYIHRAGRTGRAGKEGICTLLYTEDEENIVDLICKRSNVTMETLNVDSLPSEQNNPKKENVKFIKESNVECPEEKKSCETKYCMFRLSAWRKVNMKAAEMNKYLSQIVDFCEIKTKIDDKGIRESILFEVPYAYKKGIFKLMDQFKADGLYAEEVFQNTR